jgi:hypothetical protein
MPIIPLGSDSIYPDLSAIMATPRDEYEARLDLRLLGKADPALLTWARVRRSKARMSLLRPSKRAVWDPENPWELAEAADLADYLERRTDLTLWYHVPNERQGQRAGNQMAIAGVRAGVPDYSIDHRFVNQGRSYPGIKIELKRRKRGSTKVEQRWWIECYRRQGWIAEVCPGASVAIRLVEWAYGLDWLP